MIELSGTSSPLMAEHERDPWRGLTPAAPRRVRERARPRTPATDVAREEGKGKTEKRRGKTTTGPWLPFPFFPFPSFPFPYYLPPEAGRSFESSARPSPSQSRRAWVMPSLTKLPGHLRLATTSTRRSESHSFLNSSAVGRSGAASPPGRGARCRMSGRSAGSRSRRSSGPNRREGSRGTSGRRRPGPPHAARPAAARRAACCCAPAPRAALPS